MALAFGDRISRTWPLELKEILHKTFLVERARIAVVDLVWPCLIDVGTQKHSPRSHHVLRNMFAAASFVFSGDFLAVCNLVDFWASVRRWSIHLAQTLYSLKCLVRVS